MADIAAHACVALNAGCFAAGTKLLTRSGYKCVEEIEVGDEVASRHELDPQGEVQWKPVEATFRRTGHILHLHFPNGELIRTTPEHPFFVEGKGWTPAGSLKPQDRIATLSGEWVSLSEVYDTGEWEVVYNLRVADYHTYFVGDERWGWAAWAHNVYFNGDGEGCIQQRLESRYNWSKTAAGAVAKLGNRSDVHGNVLLEYTEWWIREKNVSLKNVIPGMESYIEQKIAEFVSQKNIEALGERFRLRGELVGKTTLPQPSLVRANPYNLDAQTLQIIIDDIFTYAFRGDSRKDSTSPLALTITSSGRIVLSQAGGGVEPRALARAQYYFGNIVETTTKNQARLSNNEDNIHAEEAAISLLGTTASQGAKQVCTWYACDDCKALQQQYGVINLTGYASDHNNIYKRW